MPPKAKVKLSLVLFLLVVVSSPAPAFAYGDPSGGFLFQVLTPIVALLWGVWLAFAHSIHKLMSKLFGRLRGTTPEESQDDPGEVTSP